MADEFVKGLDELMAELKDLPGNIEKGALRTSMFRAAQFMRDKVKEAAPISSGEPPKGKRFAKYPPGTLRKSIKAKRRRGTATEAAAAITGAFYAKWVEFGHVLKGHKPGKVTLGQVAPNPFILNAFEANKEAALEVARKGLVEEIAKRIARLRSRMPKV
jgi:HK97 gp10 family phage protein